MTIRSRLTLQFMALTGILLAGVLSVVLTLFGQYLRSEFNARLRDRAEIAAYLFVRDEELTDRTEQKLRRRYLEKLADEVLQIYDSELRARFIKKDRRVKLSERLLTRIVSEREVYFRLGERQAVGLFLNDDDGDFVVVAAARDRYGNNRLERLALMMAVAYVASLLVLYLLGRWFAARALRPISAMNDEVDQISAHDLHLRLGEGTGPDELARLAHTFNRLLARLEDSFRAQRSFVSNASHELRTPLTATIGELQVLLNRARSVEDYQTALRSVLDELLGLKHLSNDLLELAQTLAGPEAEAAEDVRLDEVLDDAVAVVRAARPAAVLRLDLTALPPDPDALLVRGHARLLTRALANLLENACKYSFDQPVEVRLSVDPTRRSALRLCIRDRGIGIAPADQALVFEPFYRAANARAQPGHGIGLALTDRIIRQHGGTLTLHSVEGEGTEVVVGFR